MPTASFSRKSAEPILQKQSFLVLRRSPFVWAYSSEMHFGCVVPLGFIIMNTEKMKNSWQPYQTRSSGYFHSTSCLSYIQNTRYTAISTWLTNPQQPWARMQRLSMRTGHPWWRTHKTLRGTITTSHHPQETTPRTMETTTTTLSLCFYLTLASCQVWTRDGVKFQERLVVHQASSKARPTLP